MMSTQSQTNNQKYRITKVTIRGRGSHKVNIPTDCLSSSSAIISVQNKAPLGKIKFTYVERDRS